MNISKEDQDRITKAIRAAEAKTSGEIVCVLAQTSTQATASPVFIAAVIALALPWLLTAFTAMTVFRILSLQIVVFLALLMLLCLPRVRVALMPRRARRAAAYRLAMEQFVGRGLARNNSQSGISHFRFSGGALCAHCCWHRDLCAGTPEPMAGSRGCFGCAHAKWPYCRGFHHGDRNVRGGARKALPHTTADRNELPDRIYLI